ncbi:bifunctional sugar phosphate isomerase/epimerase/4-hydroxyphenylpyruvate dioxygenase family protein [Citricoccus sp. GCM10030269]|uniref:bifunctional sugar phosphate isomerase/epimerase/4-hydroxyphenylpyruvate dioxygenase family protein n=1 Tax=Citricoccus sp. GCM10030269 TaxID=3273388 RepID=UPI0036151DB1
MSQSDHTGPHRMSRTSIATVCLAGTLEEKMRAAAEAGFDGIEVFEPDLVASPLSPEQVRELAEELGLSLDLYQPFRDLEGVEDEVFEDNLRRLEAKFQLMRRLGVDLILLCSNVGTATRWEDEVAVEQLRRAADLAADYSIRIAYEALAWGRFVNTYEHSWSLVEQADHANLGICLDSFHILSRRGDVTGFRNIPGEKIFFVQMADAPIKLMDVLSWSRHHRNFPGEGGFDLVSFMRELYATGYTGPVSLEVFSDIYRQTESVRTAREAMRSLRWLDDAQAGDAPAHPTGWDFAEVRAAEPAALAEVLTQLGFADNGRHRTKDIRLFSAGEARVVTNDRHEGPLDQAGGSVIASIGLQVPDPRATAHHARDLHYPQAWRANRADEMVLRGVQAPDGTEVFLAPSAAAPQWVQEYGARSGEPASADVGNGLLLGIDHVNLAQPWQWFEEGVLFYRSLFGLEAQVSNDVASPQGLVRSEVMRTPDGAVRIPLNLIPHGLDPGRSSDTRTITSQIDHDELRLKAAYPQHVAFLATDAIEVARRARARGLRMLPVPSNYYEDLAARFDLDTTLLAELREHDVMYDRDERGEFLHFYTRTVGTVFFEVVERRDGYDGYGAGSAPVRLAAQYDLDRQ